MFMISKPIWQDSDTTILILSGTPPFSALKQFLMVYSIKCFRAGVPKLWCVCVCAHQPFDKDIPTNRMRLKDIFT